MDYRKNDNVLNLVWGVGINYLEALFIKTSFENHLMIAYSKRRNEQIREVLDRHKGGLVA